MSRKSKNRLHRHAESREPDGLSRLRAEHAAKAVLVREQIAALDNFSWQAGRFYEPGVGWLGGWGGGYAADRSQDKSHSAIPHQPEEEWRQHVFLVREMAQRNHLLVGFAAHVKAFIGPVSVQFVRRGGAPGAAASGPVDADGDGYTDADPIVTRVQEAWDECCERNDWGQGETDREEECLDRALIEGEATLEAFRGGRGEVPLLRHVEPELIRTPDSLPHCDFAPWATPDDWRGGVLTRPNDAETPLALWVADVGRVVRADRFVRTKLNVVRSVKRGMSDFFPVAELLRKVSGLLDNMGHVARLQAAIAWWESYPNATEQQVRGVIEANRDYQGLRLPGAGFGTAGANARTADVKHYDAGTVVRTEHGREVNVGPTSQPNGFAQVEQAIMRSVSFRFGLPSSFSGEADSFASSLVSGSPFVRIIEARQKKQQGFTRAVVERVVLLCEESGRLPEGAWRRVKPVLSSKPVVIADQEKQARTFLSLLEKGCADPLKFIAANGDEPEELYANVAAHKKKMAQMDAEDPQGPPGAPPDQPPAPQDPAPAPPGSAGGDGSSPNGPDPLAGLFEGVSESGPPGPPPRPGLVWKDSTSRWVRKDTGAEHAPDADADEAARDAAAEELDSHAGGHDAAHHVDHDDYMADFEFGDPADVRDRFAGHFNDMLAEKDDYAAKAADYAGAGEGFATAYQEHRIDLVTAGEEYKDAIGEMADAHAGVEALKSDIDVLRHATLDAEDYGRPLQRPDDPTKLPKWQAAMAAFEARKAKAVGDAKEKRRAEIDEVKARLVEPRARYRAAGKAAKAAHAALSKANARIVGLIAPLHAADAAVRESLVSEAAAAERVLREAGFSGERTDALGRKTTWVDGKRVAKAKPAPKEKPPTKAAQQQAAKADAAANKAAAKAAADKLAAGGEGLTADDVRALDAHHATLSVPEMKAVAKAIGAKLSGAKKELAGRLMDAARAKVAGGGKGEPAAAAGPPAPAAPHQQARAALDALGIGHAGLSDGQAVAAHAAGQAAMRDAIRAHLAGRAKAAPPAAQTKAEPGPAPAAPAAKPAKKAAPTLAPEHEPLHAELGALIERTRLDPDGVSDAEMDEVIGRVARLPDDQQVLLAKRLGSRTPGAIRSAATAQQSIRKRLTTQRDMRDADRV